jgi:hypothetical protein
MAEDAEDALDADLDADELMRMVQQLNDNLTGSFDEMFKVYPLVWFGASPTERTPCLCRGWSRL